MRPLVLLSNDDGFAAVGLRMLREELLRVADVVICAPASEQSGTSHSISLNRPLRLLEQEPGIFSVDGTPADCVYVALNADQRVLPRRPDIVVSGLNHGLNLGNDVFYSGTVAAAREGALKGINGLAVSASSGADRQAASKLTAALVVALYGLEIDTALLLNANFPDGDDWPVEATKLGTRQYSDGVLFREDPRGGEYLWIGTGDVAHAKVEGSDTWAFDRGVVGVTPLSLELWAEKEQVAAQATVDAALRLHDTRRG
jgi:5'-nucleotidase